MLVADGRRPITLYIVPVNGHLTFLINHPCPLQPVYFFSGVPHRVIDDLNLRVLNFPLYNAYGQQPAIEGHPTFLIHKALSPACVSVLGLPTGS